MSSQLSQQQVLSLPLAEVREDHTDQRERRSKPGDLKLVIDRFGNPRSYALVEYTGIALEKRMVASRSELDGTRDRDKSLVHVEKEQA